MILYFIIFILGLIVGSFLNVVVFRLENGEKIINDRSKCLCCKRVLSWYDLIPIFSFIFLKGRCRHCGNSISIQYPLVEIATGILFVSIFNFSAQGGPVLGWQFSIFNFQTLINFYFLLSTFYFLFITSVLIIIFVYDLKHYIIPDKVIYPAIAIAFIYRIFEILKFNHLDLIGNWKLPAQGWSAFGGEIGNLITIFNPFVAAVLAGAFFLGIVLLTRGNGMGGGDIKLGFLIGLIVGWPLILIALFLSFITGSVVGIFLILVGNKKMKSAIPFGPFLVLGTFLALFGGEEIMGWYFNNFVF